MYAATMNSPVSNHMGEQVSGSSPVQRGQIKRQEFIVWKHKLFSVIHIVLGVALGIVSVMGIRCDIIAEEKHEDCFEYGRTLYSSDQLLVDVDISCLICSLFIHGFKLCSLIGSLVIAPTMAYLGYVGVNKRLNYHQSTTNISVCIAGIFVAEWVLGIAIIVGSVCSWFSETESSSQQDVIVVNSTQFQVIPTANVEPAIMPIEETSFQIVQHHTPQQYQVMETNEPEVDYIQE
ncbi:Hypothetical predicted protein [Mytilus galloprovincialis]|uniref:Uncharacterized protein n=1 Tax=Mytilus galloprovincialis TaxID=29158 RepID=A0A8B6GID2_MYTGA|nr:Hypothetical predicted protein [Mytilus galloprovincialis]